MMRPACRVAGRVCYEAPTPGTTGGDALRQPLGWRGKEDSVLGKMSDEAVRACASDADGDAR